MSNDSLTEPQRAWVEALRSGKYKQTTHVLCRLDEQGEPVGYCCLGVACELAREAGVELAVYTDSVDRGDGSSVYALAFDAESTYLPDSVVEWLGLAGSVAEYVDGDLPGMNDRGETFGHIADIIESKPAGLFVEPTA